MLLKLKDAARQLGVTAETLRLWIVRDHKLKGVLLPGAAGWRVDEDELGLFIKKLTLS